MGMRSANAIHEEEPHWKLSQVSLQCNAADMTDDDNLGVALEATVQVSLVCTCLSPETYDVCGVHAGIHKRVMDHVTLANRWQSPLPRQTTWCNIPCNGLCILSCIHSVQAFLYK
jgi:hypothetical protein